MARDPYTIVHGSTIARKDISHVDFRVLTALSILQGPEASITTSAAHVAEASSLTSKSQAAQSIRHLEAADLITVIHGKRGSLNTVSVHAVTAKNKRHSWVIKRREQEQNRRANLAVLPKKGAP